MGFSCTAHQSDSKVTLAVAGDVDLAAYRQFEDQSRIWATGPRDLVVDCSGISFMDSMGLHVLVDLRRRVHAAGCELVLAAAPEPVLRVLELAGMTGQFKLADGTGATVTDPTP